MKRAVLRLAPEKAVAVMLTGRKWYNNIEIHLEDVTITPVKDAKYQGVIVGKDLSCRQSGAKYYNFKNTGKNVRTERKVALKITKGYRTMSTEIVRVLAGVIPFQLLAEARNQAIGKTVAEKKRLRENIVQKWQDRWRESEDKWIKRVIPDIRACYNRTDGAIN